MIHTIAKDPAKASQRRGGISIFQEHQFKVILEATRICQKKTTVFETKDINEIEDKTLPKKNQFEIIVGLGFRFHQSPSLPSFPKIKSCITLPEISCMCKWEMIS
jgi:hypothetical protein